MISNFILKDFEGRKNVAFFQSREINTQYKRIKTRVGKKKENNLTTCIFLKKEKEVFFPGRFNSG